MFESVSAFATVGLSTGVTAISNEISRVILMLTMFPPFAITKEICKVAEQPKGCAAALRCQAVFFFRFCIPSLPSRATQSSSAILIMPAVL